MMYVANKFPELLIYHAKEIWDKSIQHKYINMIEYIIQNDPGIDENQIMDIYKKSRENDNEKMVKMVNMILKYYPHFSTFKIPV